MIIPRSVYVNMRYDNTYLNILRDLIDFGESTKNRTGIDCLQKHGLYFEVDLQKEFPLLTTKTVYWKSAFAEMLGFIRGYTNAEQFRKLGCSVWNQNANENEEWLKNQYRKGTDDLGKIYGYQWRNWQAETGHIDQLYNVIQDLKNNVDNRREIITAWNPGELDQMALPPCHSLMQFGLRDNKAYLDLFVYQRSQDIFLGNPFNVAQYSFLLHLIAKITNHKPGKLMCFVFNYHLYKNHVEQAKQQYSRSIKRIIPTIEISDEATTLDFLMTTEIPVENWVAINNYNPHPPIKASMAV